MKRAVFLDKDGTLIHDVPYNVDPTRIVLTKNTGLALQLLKANGFALIVISNQPGIALGYFEPNALDKVYRRLQFLLGQFDVSLDGFYYCPHRASAAGEVECRCRKPAPGLLIDAATSHSIDLSNSWMIGDILNDVEAGNRAGCGTILLNNGNETEWLMNAQRQPTYMAADLLEAAMQISKQPVNHALRLE
jgi:D-glycero-D-manno-heptose 1,7-bisphosphate phosphatase